MFVTPQISLVTQAPDGEGEGEEEGMFDGMFVEGDMLGNADGEVDGEFEGDDDGNALGLEFHHPSILRNTTPGQLNYCVQRTSQKIARLGSKDHIKSKIRQVKQINP